MDILLGWANPIQTPTGNVVEALTIADLLVVLRVRYQYVQQFEFNALEENVVGKCAWQIDFYRVHWNGKSWTLANVQ